MAGMATSNPNPWFGGQSKTDPDLLAKMRAMADREFHRAQLAAAPSPFLQPIIYQPPLEPITKFSDADLIFEMIGRGYAVAKMSPEQLAEVA